MRGLICFFGKLLFSVKNKAIPKNPKKILVIRSGAIGDVLMTTPFLKSIRKKFPKAEITYLTGNWSKDVLKNNPNINNIISFEDQIIFKRQYSKVNKLKEQIKKENFDLCFLLDKSYLFNLLVYKCKIPFRIGFNRKGEGFPNNLNINYDGSKYELDYYLDLAKLAKAEIKNDSMELFPSKYDKEIIKSISEIKNFDLIGIAPGGAENPGQKVHMKRWPAENYIKLIKKLVKRRSTKIILFGGPGDEELNNEMAEIMNNVINTAGKLSIQQSYLLMKKCKLFITHDSGSLHMAAASKVPLIALFGPTPSQRFAPRKSLVITPESEYCPCYDIYGKFNCKTDCMSLIKTEDVLEKANKILK